MPTAHLSDVNELIRQERDRFVAAVVHLNDTYVIEERGTRLPGFPRLISTVRYLRDQVAKVTGEDGRVIVLHSGDFIGPSLLSNHDRGAAMSELLHRSCLDYCLPGNHEFDHGAENLVDQVAGRRFKLLCANLRDPTGLVPVQPRALWYSGGKPHVAITGVVSKSVAKSYRSPERKGLLPHEVPWTFEPPNEALVRFFEDTADVPFHLILSHANQAEDRELRRQLPAMPRTYLLGGHDHDVEWIEGDRDVWLMKNLANLETVRVAVLLAGGDSVVGTLLGCATRLGERRAANALNTRLPEDLVHPEDIEPLLAPMHDCDREVVVQRLAGRTLLHPGDTWRALAALYGGADIKTWKLAYPDHPPAAQVDLDYVRDSLAAIPLPNLNVLIRDFTPETDGEPVEARESRIRRRQTDFGGFVAECVRRQGGADVAILNSGAFRSDSLIGPALQMRDIVEGFLYDTHDAVITLQVHSGIVDALLIHAASRLGQGAYCQVSDRRASSSSPVKLAIAKYLVADERSIDGFDAVLAQAQNLPDAAAARDWVAAHIGQHYSVIDSIRTHGAAAPLGVSGIATTELDLAGDIIDQLKAYADAFFDKVQSETAPSRPATQHERDRLFDEWLGSDDVLALAEVQKPRDAVRKLLRGLPAVAAATTPADLPSLRAAAEALAAMRAVVGGHDFNFRDRADYGWMFNLATRGIPGGERRERL